LGSWLAVGVRDGVGGSTGEEGSEKRDTGADRIFPQVAAAIAALHERLSQGKRSGSASTTPLQTSAVCFLET
jgi:hypothetical protein